MPSTESKNEDLQSPVATGPEDDGLATELGSIRETLQTIAESQSRIEGFLKKLLDVETRRYGLPDIVSDAVSFIQTVGHSFTNISERMADLEESVSSRDAGEDDARKAPSRPIFSFRRPEERRKPAPKPVTRLRKKNPLAAMGVWEKVVHVIRESEEGESLKSIVQKTGLNQKQVYNAVAKALKDGNIERVGRGRYRGV